MKIGVLEDATVGLELAEEMLLSSSRFEHDSRNRSVSCFSDGRGAASGCALKYREQDKRFMPWGKE